MVVMHAHNAWPAVEGERSIFGSPGYRLRCLLSSGAVVMGCVLRYDRANPLS